jgi:hypothetical protein
VVAWGGSATAAANSTFDVTQTVWVLTSSGTSVLNQWNVAAFSHPSALV